jgi:hypothetical protein
MNIRDTIRTLIGLPPRVSVLLESDHGLGKSSVVAQVASMLSQQLKKPFGFIDFRLAQMEVGDLIGMMRHVPQGEVKACVYNNGVRTEESRKIVNATVHDLAEWFPTDPDSCGFLFLDELPRAPRDVQNAVLELALDYRFHFHSLPEGWRVVSAANANMDVYSGTQLDPALYDRFLKIQFKPTFDEWFSYAEKEGVHRAILTYLTKFTADLGLDATPEPGKITPTPRSWCKLSTVIDHMVKNGDDVMRDHNYLTLLAKGYIGDIAVNFVDYIKKNYKVYNAEDILNKWSNEIETDFKSMLVTEIAFYTKEICDYVAKTDKALTKKQGENLYRFLISIDKEAASGFWSSFSGQCKQHAAWYKQEIEVEGKKIIAVQKYVCDFLFKGRAVK